MISLQRDRLDGSALSTDVMDSPDEVAVLGAFRALDGRKRTQLWLHVQDGRHLLVTGPVDGCYALDFSEADGGYCYAVDRTQPAGSVLVTAGNEAVEIPLRGLIEASATETALLEFLRRATLASNLEWESPR